MTTCASCDSTLPDGARFCPACGHEIAPPAAEERRVVTVVFADLVGYTALSEHLDPERVKRLIDASFERLIADITAFGGRIDKVLGDGILALFGAPVAHEDDADRAIRAALQMHESLARFVDEQPDLDGPLRLRIGVNTGEVVVGNVSGTAEYTAMGDVVNVASRLQSLAEPGGILIGDATESLASEEILREPVDTLDVRGRAQQVRVWRVTGRRRRVPRIGARFHDVAFVGRSTQWELLASIMAMAANGRSAIVSVTGEAGAGKTRLVAEALDAFPSRAVTIFSGACAPYGETNVWAPIATALFRRLELDQDAPPELLREVSRAKGVELYGFDADDPVLGRFVEGVLHLVGHPSELDDVPPAQAREILFSLIVEGLRRRTRTGPVVLWIDDLQWADVLILELLHRVARSLVDRPLLIVTAQRDDADIDWPPVSDHPVTVRMPLDPLTHDEAGRLISAVLGPMANAALVDNLYERSGGNPLFLIELAELAKSNPASTTLPGSLRALISARLDQLPVAQRAIIDNAAVLGASGPVVSLEKFAVEMDQRFDPDDLEELLESGLLEIDGPTWEFRSDVVREVAYQTLTKLVRAQRHGGTAAVMRREQNVPIEQVAHHAACAAELAAEIGPVPGLPDDIADRAVGLLYEAAKRSMDVGAFNQVRRQTTRALDLGPSDASIARELLLLRAQAQTERRALAPALADADDALEAAVAAADRRQEGVARRLRGVLHQRDGDLAGARRELGASVDIFRDLGDDTELAASLRERGLAEVFGGSLSDAEWLLGEAESLTERMHDLRGRAWVRQHQAWVAFLSGDAALAETRLLTAAQEFDLLGDRFGRGWAAGLLAYVRFYQRRFEEAEALAVEVRRDSVELGDAWAPAMMDSLIAAIHLWSSRFVEAEELSRRALTNFRQIGDKFGVVQALAPRMRALVALGRTHEAERGIEESLAMSESFGNLSFPMMAAAGTAVHLGLGDRALSISELALDRSLAMGADGSESRITLALALCQVGRADEALAVLEVVESVTPYMLSVRALARAITGDPSGSIDDADQVAADAGASYLDRVIAGTSAGAAAMQLGRRDDSVARFDDASSTARGAGDVVARELVGLTRSVVLHEPSHREAGHLGSGWRSVAASLAALVVDRPGEPVA
ncbi:MAG TPA: adenylate/guanylate cyclase domain-containing protein [Ilumatobacteraceae bacterium]|nr:adenylate/guanylate cyclase domain-containing protein [Ilumatobacteraceae bacterium]